MGLFVSTTGTNVNIPELGITISHPTTNLELSAQFTAEDLRGAGSLTTAITVGTLTWKKTAGGSVQPAADYDADWVEAEQKNTGSGAKPDRVVTFKDMTSAETSFDNSTNGFTATNAQAAIEEAKQAASNIGHWCIQAGFDGSAIAGRHLKFAGNVPSDTTSMIVPRDCYIEELSFGCGGSTTVLIGVYKNMYSTPVLIGQIQITSARKGYSTGLSIALVAGNEIGVKVISGSASRPLLNIWGRYA